MCRQHDKYAVSFFFFNDTPPTEIYPLSLPDALPISAWPARSPARRRPSRSPPSTAATAWVWPCWAWPSSSARPPGATASRSEEHTSELQSRQYLVCRLLLEKKKKDRQCKCDTAR